MNLLISSLVIEEEWERVSKVLLKSSYRHPLPSSGAQCLLPPEKSVRLDYSYIRATTQSSFMEREISPAGVLLADLPDNDVSKIQ